LALADRLASLEAQLPGISPDQESSDQVPASGLHLDPAARRAWFSGKLLELRPREYDLLFCLAQHPSQVLSRSVLLDLVWGTADYIDDRTVDVHVHRLRQKLAEADPTLDPIQTERGIGYRWAL
jgi:DNA-binding response OmpR family regulator